jgi:V8-like Glu-specific endopeptidase
MDARYLAILRRAESTFGDQKVTDVIGKTRAIIGVRTMPAGEEEAQAAFDKLRKGILPKPMELAALEVMMHLMRPAPLCRNGQLDPLPEYNKFEPGLVEAWNRFRDFIQPYLMAVGRIDRTTGGEEGTGLGTGFLVSDELLITNRHVLDALTYGAGEIGEGQGVVNFEQQFDRADTEKPWPIVAKVAAHQELDVVVLRVRPATNRRPLKIVASVAAPLDAGTRVVAIGYPSNDPARNPLFIRRIYNDTFGVKRAAPGQVTDADEEYLFHDCSTLGGNSGSPLIAMNSGEVIGVHSSGFFMYRNEAVRAESVETLIKEIY